MKLINRWSMWKQETTISIEEWIKLKNSEWLISPILEDTKSKICMLGNLELDIQFSEDKIQLKLAENLVWEIYESSYEVCEVEYDHLWIEVDENYRNMWLWIRLYELWEENGNELPEIEFTKNIDKIRFFESVGYRPFKFIHDITWTEEEYCHTNDSAKDMFQKWYSLQFVYEI